MKSTRQSLKEPKPAFFDLDQLADRWHCHRMTAHRRLLKLGIKPKKPSERAVLYRTSDIELVEAAW